MLLDDGRDLSEILQSFVAPSPSRRVLILEIRRKRIHDRDQRRWTKIVTNFTNKMKRRTREISKRFAQNWYSKENERRKGFIYKHRSVRVGVSLKFLEWKWIRGLFHGYLLNCPHRWLFLVICGVHMKAFAFILAVHFLLGVVIVAIQWLRVKVWRGMERQNHVLLECSVRIKRGEESRERYFLRCKARRRLWTLEVTICTDRNASGPPDPSNWLLIHS